MTPYEDRCAVADHLDRVAPAQPAHLRKAFQDQAYVLRQWTIRDTDRLNHLDYLGRVLTGTHDTGPAEYQAHYA